MIRKLEIYSSNKKYQNQRAFISDETNALKYNQKSLFCLFK
jgi:hypothetical protein